MSKGINNAGDEVTARGKKQQQARATSLDGSTRATKSRHMGSECNLLGCRRDRVEIRGDHQLHPLGLQLIDLRFVSGVPRMVQKETCQKQTLNPRANCMHTC